MAQAQSIFIPKVESNGLSTLPPGYLTGGLISRNVTNPAFQVDIASGSARSDDDTENLVFGTLTADITVSGVNGLDVGAEAANTWYSVWVIGGGGNPLASLLSASAAAPTLPGTYTKKRRVGWVRNDAASDFRQFTMFAMTGRDRVVKYDDVDENVVQVLSAATATIFTDVDLTEFVPPTSTTAIMLALHDGTNLLDYVSFRPDGATTAIPPQRILGGIGTTEFWINCPSQIIEYANASALDDTYAWIMGFVESL